MFLSLIANLLQLSAQETPVIFSAPGGLYDASFFLELNCPDAYHIRYTTNGNTPSAESKLYEAPLWLDEQLYSYSDIFKIQISPDELAYVPDSVRHAIVIRAAAFDRDEQRVGATVTHTYLIRALGCETAGLPVVSLCTDSLALFDYDTGILVPGAFFDAGAPERTGNYYQSGKEWEREANVEFFEPTDNSGINQVCGLRTHGNLSRRYTAKGMKIYAREEYGKKRFEHRFFSDSPLGSFKHLILKPFALFWPFSGAQDYVCNAQIDAFLQGRVEHYLDAMDSFPLLRDDVNLSDLDHFTCYPNPTNGEFRITMQEDWPRPIVITVYNAMGQRVYCQSVSLHEGEGITLHAHLAPGVYLLQIGSCTRRLVKF